MQKLKLNYWDLLDRVWYVTKTRQDNDVTDRVDMFYVENDTKLSWPIGLSVVSDEN